MHRLLEIYTIPVIVNYLKQFRRFPPSVNFHVTRPESLRALKFRPRNILRTDRPRFQNSMKREGGNTESGRTAAAWNRSLERIPGISEARRHLGKHSSIGCNGLIKVSDLINGTSLQSMTIHRPRHKLEATVLDLHSLSSGVERGNLLLEG